MGMLDFVNWCSYILGAISAAIWMALCYRFARKRKDTAWFYYLLCGFYACVLMCNVFYLLVWVVDEYPFVFSPGDISWVGGIFFLIAIDLELWRACEQRQAQAARKYRLPALIAPLVCVAFNAVYIRVYPEITVNYLLYGIPTAILAYHSLWLLIACRKSLLWPGMWAYHFWILLWLADQLVCDLFSTFGGYPVPVAVFSALLPVLSTSVYFGARKGANA